MVVMEDGSISVDNQWVSLLAASYSAQVGKYELGRELGESSIVGDKDASIFRDGIHGVVWANGNISECLIAVVSDPWELNPGTC